MAEISWRAGQQIGQRHEAPVRVVRKSIGERHGEVLRARAVNGTVKSSKSTACSVQNGHFRAIFGLKNWVTEQNRMLSPILKLIEMGYQTNK